MPQFLRQFQKINWKFLIPNIVVQMICWSYVAVSYAVSVKMTVFQGDLSLLFIYQFFVGLTITLMNEKAGSAPILISLIISAILALDGLWHGNLIVAALSLLMPLCQLIIFWRILEHPAESQWLCFCCIYSLTIPIVMIRLISGFVSLTSVISLLPLLMTVAFFQSPIWTKHASYQLLDSTIAGILAIICLLAMRPFGLPIFIGILIIGASWWLLMSRHPLVHSPAAINFTQMIVIILAYWH